MHACALGYADGKAARSLAHASMLMAPTTLTTPGVPTKSGMNEALLLRTSQAPQQQLLLTHLLIFIAQVTELILPVLCLNTMISLKPATPTNSTGI